MLRFDVSVDPCKAVNGEVTLQAYIALNSSVQHQVSTTTRPRIVVVEEIRVSYSVILDLLKRPYDVALKGSICNEDRVIVHHRPLSHQLEFNLSRG